MSAFLLIAAVIITLMYVVIGILIALGRLYRVIALCGTFLVVALGAYAAVFVVDMILGACLEEIIPPSNVVWPCMTWGLISCCALLAGASQHPPRAVRIIPFVILTVLALVAALVHTRNLVIALVLILLGALYDLGVRKAIAGGTGS